MRTYKCMNDGKRAAGRQYGEEKDQSQVVRIKHDFGVGR